MRICAVPGCENAVSRPDTDTCSYQHGYALRSLNQQRQKDGLPALTATGEDSPLPAVPRPQAKPEHPKKEVLSVEEEHRLRKENRALRAQLDSKTEEFLKNSKFSSFIEATLSRPVPEPPQWTWKAKAGNKQAMPTAFLSDMHFGEVVFPEQVEGLNGYDREIAEDRLQRFFFNTVDLCRTYLKGLNYPGIVMPIGGDSYSGNIHEELEKTNAGTIQEEILYWLDPMIAGITLLAEEFGKIHIPCVVGNHPRSTKKPSHKMRVPNNFDWLFYQLLAKFLAHDKRVTFQISKSADLDYQIYSTRYRLSHGDQFKGGSGIAGALSPMMIGDARKRKRALQTHRPYDWLIIGHWHQLFKFKGIICNGSLKGFDEFAYHSNFDFEPPQQAFWLTDPEKGVTINAPIHVLGKNESWMREQPTVLAA